MVANNQLFLTDIPALTFQIDTCSASIWLGKILSLVEDIGSPFSLEGASLQVYNWLHTLSEYEMSNSLGLGISPYEHEFVLVDSNSLTNTYQLEGLCFLDPSEKEQIFGFSFGPSKTVEQLQENSSTTHSEAETSGLASMPLGEQVISLHLKKRSPVLDGPTNTPVHGLLRLE